MLGIIWYLDSFSNATILLSLHYRCNDKRKTPELILWGSSAAMIVFVQIGLKSLKSNVKCSASILFICSIFSNSCLIRSWLRSTSGIVQGNRQKLAKPRKVLSKWGVSFITTSKTMPFSGKVTPKYRLSLMSKLMSMMSLIIPCVVVPKCDGHSFIYSLIAASVFGD